MKTLSRQQAYHQRQLDADLDYIHIYVPKDQSAKFKAQAKRAVKKHLRSAT